MSEVQTRIKVKARLSYANIHTPYTDPKKKDEKPKYKCALLISKEDTKTMAEIEKIIDALTADFKASNKGKLPKEFRTPLHDGDTDRDDDAPEFKGRYWLNASSKNKPSLMWKVQGEVQTIPESEAENAVYSGCYVAAIVNFFTYDNEGKGIGVGLQGLFKIRDGEKLGGVSVSKSDFEDEDDTEFESVEDDDLMG